MIETCCFNQKQHFERVNGKQRLIVYGQLMCDGKPYKDAVTKIYDKDVLIDSLMATNNSKPDGTFYLDGTATDILSSIDPHLYIYHKCNKGKLSCKREWILKIPKDYVYDAKNKVVGGLDVGILELMLKPKDETYKCLPAEKQ
uniref:Transthyretin-like family protein n=1 Tax=Romanomermis culicivorax TaxID=13658 RepID=A0A915I2Y1_ROMCU